MKRIFILTAALCVALCGCQSGAASESSAPENTTTVTGRVSAVSGNDFTLALGTYGDGASSGGYTSGGESGEGRSSGRGGRSSSGDSTGTGTGMASPGGETPLQTAQAGGMPAADGMPEMPSAGFEGVPPDSDAQGGAASGGVGGSVGRFTENGGELQIRIPVGTPILYGSLKVDFSQIQLDYVIQLTMKERDDGTRVVISAEILST